MRKEFVQVSCSKLNGDFIFCSNLSLMDNQKLSPARAMQELHGIAERAQFDGFTVEWTIEELGDHELAFYGDLFEDRLS